MRSVIRVVALVAVMAAATTAMAAKAAKPKLDVPDVKQWQLANGLKVIFLADHKAPVVTVQVFYHVGGKDEPAGSAASRTCSST